MSVNAVPKLSPMPTKSYWHTRDVFRHGRPVGVPVVKELLKKHKTDVCIIGSGIAGCSLAYHLARLSDVSVTLVDGRHIAGAATGRNGGLLWPCLNASFRKVLDTKGPEQASEIMRFESNATEQIAEFLMKTEGMQELTEFSYYKDGGLILFETEEEALNEMEDYRLMREFGFGDELDVWDAEEVNRRLGSQGYWGAIRMPRVGRVWAARLTLGLALEAARASSGNTGSGGSTGSGGTGRLSVIEAAEVMAVEQLEERVKPGGSCLAAAGQQALAVKTSRGDLIQCSTVVYCTNAYSSGLLPELQGKLVPVRNQVVVTSPLPQGQRIPLDASVYARQGYVYWSPRADGKLVLGGFRDELPHKEVGTFDDGSLDPRVSASIRGYLPAHFPDLFSGADKLSYEMEWAGILGFTQDRFPLVGPLSAGSSPAAASRAGQYICAGFSGHGMTRAYSCAEGLARTLLGLPQGPAALPRAFLPDGRI